MYFVKVYCYRSIFEKFYFTGISQQGLYEATADVLRIRARARANESLILLRYHNLFHINI